MNEEQAQWLKQASAEYNKPIKKIMEIAKEIPRVIELPQKTITRCYKLNKNYSFKEIEKKARKAVAPEERKDISKEKPSFVFYDQPDVSDLVVIEYNPIDKVFDFRQCAQGEWTKFFRENLA